MATLASIPEDIIMDILSKLSVESISRFRCGCLLYIDFDVTSSSYHMVVATNIPRDDTFVLDSLLTDSCDGLIGSSTCDPNGYTLGMICLWNLSTREYKNIPRPASDISHTNFSRYGVCYDRKIDDYKLFRIVADTRFSITSEVWVSRLGTNSWNSIGNIPYHIHRIKISMKPLNGIIHWIVEERTKDIEERIKEIQMPSCYLNNEWYSSNEMEVGVLGEDLFLYINGTSGKGNLDLWVMKDYGLTYSWTKIFSVSKDVTSFHSLRPLHYLNKHREILLHGVRLEGKDDLVSYDPRSIRLVNLDITCMPKHFNATAFDESLVLLDSDEFLKATKYLRWWIPVLQALIRFLRWQLSE
ncbi:F-box protein CPR1-like [Papaver somniferum]|uniref:F-box protein CPR1-like n=1 Tax=Papaver somniferum TaxID=3469 RepID=UPI000E700DA2|nr:F-box protein CPR1-like [Papaver somniferum]